jgi:hypothetical protein
VIAVVPILHVEDAFGVEPEADWEAQVREVHLTEADRNGLRIGQR